MPIKFNHSNKLNEVLMAIISGPTNCGKSFLLFQMLTTPGILDYENLYIFTTTPEQNYYQFLLHGFENGFSKSELNKLFKENYDLDSDDIPVFLSELAIDKQITTRRKPIKVYLTCNLPAPNKLDRKMKNLVIFDDCVTDKDQSIQKEYFTRGRHNSCACFYLTQSFYGLDCQTIRRNANIFVLFHTSKRNLSSLMQDVDVGNESRFKQICNDQFSIPREHKYIMINIEKPLDERVITNIF